MLHFVRLGADENTENPGSAPGDRAWTVSEIRSGHSSVEDSILRIRGNFEAILLKTGELPVWDFVSRLAGVKEDPLSGLISHQNTVPDCF